MPEHDQAFGLKLGWLSDSDFRATEGSFVPSAVTNPTRIIMFADGLLGEDHVAPAQTWEWLAITNSDGASIEREAALSRLIDRSEIGSDDVTAAIVTVETR